MPSIAELELHPKRSGFTFPRDAARKRRGDHTSFLLIGPYDPNCGEYTFLAPPLGVWRLAGVLEASGLDAQVFDPNCCEGTPEDALATMLRQRRWDVIGISTTGMTLRYDLALAHLARREAPQALIVAGGMEATFEPELMFKLGPFDLVVLGEGELPLLALAECLGQQGDIRNVPGTAVRVDGKLVRHHRLGMNREQLRDAIFCTPYEKMPYRAYWDKFERAYRVGALPVKADREARLAEIRSVRLITLNYCPMACSFCSSTNFLHAAQGSVAAMGRLDPGECLVMMKRIVNALPEVRTIIFQDDIFVFTKDRRILPLCQAIRDAKSCGELPSDLQFISTNRIDAMDFERLRAMKQAGFRVLGFGVENFSQGVLKEFNKAHIYPFIDPMLQAAVDLGITPFLDLILTSPWCSLADLAETIRRAYHWLLAGCEMGMYPYVIPFSGAAMGRDPTLKPHTLYTRHQIADTAIAWEQPSKIPPIDATVREAILEIEAEYNLWLETLQAEVAHLPSRTRSLLWVVCASPVLTRLGERAPAREEVLEQLLLRLPMVREAVRRKLRRFALPNAARRVAAA
ncbi:MAG: cobalamin-dependent protein [Acidobacteria bacterium]|nr:cobalamin-dependent protein [Acidobacteriota bacterium]